MIENGRDGLDVTASQEPRTNLNNYVYVAVRNRQPVAALGVAVQLYTADPGSMLAFPTDWRLGDANGRAVVQAAKSHSSVPVVVVSGYVAEAFQAAEPLADLYLEKPVNPEELVTIVNELLKTSERSA